MIWKQERFLFWTKSFNPKRIDKKGSLTTPFTFITQCVLQEGKTYHCGKVSAQKQFLI